MATSAFLHRIAAAEKFTCAPKRTLGPLQTLAQGRLHLDPGGCLRIGQDGPFIIWPHDSRISKTANGRVQVIDGASGNAVHVGEEFAVADAGVDLAPSRLTQSVPPACAKGKFWLAGPVMDEADRLAMLTRQKRLEEDGDLTTPQRPDGPRQ